MAWLELQVVFAPRRFFSFPSVPTQKKASARAARFLDPGADPKSRPNLGFWNLHHIRNMRVQNWAFYFLQPSSRASQKVRVPKDNTNRRILQTMVFGIPLLFMWSLGVLEVLGILGLASLILSAAARLGPLAAALALAVASTGWRFRLRAPKYPNLGYVGFLQCRNLIQHPLVLNPQYNRILTKSPMYNQVSESGSYIPWDRNYGFW